MTFTVDWLRDAAHRKWKNRDFYLKLSSARVAGQLEAEELPEANGYLPKPFLISNDGQLEGATGLLPARWAMLSRTFIFTAAGQSLQYESAYVMADLPTRAAGGIIADYIIFPTTRTILDGQSGTITLQWSEFDGGPYVT
jgi:hypothetical protein